VDAAEGFDVGLDDDLKLLEDDGDDSCEGNICVPKPSNSATMLVHGKQLPHHVSLGLDDEDEAKEFQ
tara:strand:+ start:454 stop:654 length:201 start_codon:yes stop_codon:yes gene_type:complete